MSSGKMLISAIGCDDWPFWSFNGPHIHSVGPCDGSAAVTHSGPVSVASFLLGDCESGIGGEEGGGLGGGRPALWESFARSSWAVGATRRGTERALSHISEEEEQENDGTEESWKSVFVSEGWKTAHLEWSAY